MTRAERRPQRHLVDARPPDVAPERDERRFVRAVGVRVVDRGRHPRQRLDVLDERRPALEPDRRGQGRLGPRPGAAALQRLEQRRLLARDVGVVAAADGDAQAAEVASRAAPPPGPAAGRSNDRLQEDDRFAGTDGARGQDAGRAARPRAGVVITWRSLIEPGSPSAPLAIATGSPPSTRTACHLRAAGNQPPPRPRRPEAASRAIADAPAPRCPPQWPPQRRLCRPFAPRPRIR